MNNFLSTIFSEGTTTCYTDSPYGYKVKTEPSEQDIFYCINELHPNKDLNPTKDWHDLNQPRRADCNVVCYRNFLVELDNMPLMDQISYVKSRLPVTSITYSGGSSYHFIISLETPLKTYEDYMNMARRILAAVPEADPACKNPSRLSRLPYRLRPDTQKEQKLVYLSTRIKNSELEAKLPVTKVYEQKVRSKDEKRVYITPLILEAVHEPNVVMSRSNMTRNLFFYWLHNRFEDIGLPPDSRHKYVELAYQNLEDIEDFTFDEACAAARIGRL